MTPSPFFLRFLALFAIVAGLVGVKRVVDSYEHKELYRKDFIQEYVLARALVDGKYPYPPVPDLVKEYFHHNPKVPWAHPTPHTPPAALLSIPIGFFEYRVAVTLWVLAELCCLAFVIELLSRWWQREVGQSVTLLQKAILFLMCLGFGPVIHELWFGQFSLILLVFVTLAWLHLRENHDVAGGAYLGVAIAMKLAAWPVAVYLLFTGRWRAVLSIGIVIVALNAAAAAVMGPQAAADYYLKVGPQITKGYRKHDENYSLWTIGGRVFDEEVADVASIFVTPPLVDAPALARVVTPGVPVVVLLTALVLAWRCREFDSAFGILVCASLPINPVVWDHYLLLTAPALVVIVRRLKERGFPKWPTAVGMVCLGLAIFPYPGYLDAMVWLFGGRVVYNVRELPFAAGLITYVPLIPLAGWIGLLWGTDGGSESQISNLKSEI